MKSLTVISKRHGICIATYSDEDHDIISKHTWHVAGNGPYKHTQYMVTHIYVNGKRTCAAMHTMILGKKPGFVIDHIDRNGLNNTRENLRFATSQLNRLNSKLNANNTTGERCIRFNSKSGMFLVSIGKQVKGKANTMFFGSYKTIEEAIEARDYAFRIHFPLTNSYCRPCLNLGFTYVRGYNAMRLSKVNG